MAQLCYLCGKVLGTDRTMDHVPPKQFFPSEIRKRHKLNLTTLPVHKKCNSSFQKDEDYFVSSVGVLAMESPTGKELWTDLKRRFSRPKGHTLFRYVRSEFGKLELPGKKRVKFMDSRRVERILWKLIAGLYFLEKGQVLPKNLARAIKLYSPEEDFEDHIKLLLSRPSKGVYPGVLDHKFCDESEIKSMNAWAMLLWDHIIVTVLFHRTDCRCKLCKPNNSVGS